MSEVEGVGVAGEAAVAGEEPEQRRLSELTERRRVRLECCGRHGGHRSVFVLAGASTTGADDTPPANGLATLETPLRPAEMPSCAVVLPA
jgi:hypothetical protein